MAEDTHRQCVREGHAHLDSGKHQNVSEPPYPASQQEQQRKGVQDNQRNVTRSQTFFAQYFVAVRTPEWSEGGNGLKANRLPANPGREALSGVPR